MCSLVLAWRRIAPFLRRLGCFPLMVSGKLFGMVQYLFM